MCEYVFCVVLCAGNSFLYVVFCFFQAEDGIRDLVRSRGLGDVYKRQPPEMPCRSPSTMRIRFSPACRSLTEQVAETTFASVSYTHLTLPTSDLV